MENLDVDSVVRALEWRYNAEVPGNWKLVFDVDLRTGGLPVALVFADSSSSYTATVSVVSLKRRAVFGKSLSAAERRMFVGESRNPDANQFYSECLGFGKKSPEAEKFVQKFFSRVVVDGISAADSEFAELEVEDVLKLVLEWTVATGGGRGGEGGEGGIEGERGGQES